MLQTYPYLIFSLLLLIVFALGLVISGPIFRKSILLSAFISAPTSLASFVFVPEYWAPTRVFPFEIGLEDIFFSFATGGISWLIVIMLLRRNIGLEYKWRIILKRYAGIILIGNAIYLFWLFIIANKMIATILTVGMIGLWILLRNKNIWPVCIMGATGFTIFYVIYLKTFFIFAPEFLKQWNPEGLFGFFLFGIPVEEILWGVASGAVWPLVIAYLLNARLDKSPESLLLIVPK